MIRVNLSGAPKTTQGGGESAETSAAVPSCAVPLLLIMIVVGTAAAGWFWYSRLSGQLDDVNKQLVQAQQERDKLALVIKQDQIYEARKKALESRIAVIEGLKRGQVSP